MRKTLKALGLCAAILTAIPTANAADIYLAEYDHETAAVIITGTIELGDEDRVGRALLHLAKTTKPPYLAIAVDSNGGNSFASRSIAKYISTLSAVVVVPEGAICASGCFTILAAGKIKVMATDSMIGIHRHWNKTTGRDTWRGTEEEADFLSALDVPLPIIQKMLRTPSASGSWLDMADKLSLNGAKVGATAGDIRNWTRGAQLVP